MDNGFLSGTVGSSSLYTSLPMYRLPAEYFHEAPAIGWLELNWSLIGIELRDFPRFSA